jgi:hypothetical protein
MEIIFLLNTSFISRLRCILSKVVNVSRNLHISAVTRSSKKNTSLILLTMLVLLTDAFVSKM